MASKSAISQSIARLREQDQENAARFIDLQLALEDLATTKRLITIGGAWDRFDKRYTGAAATEHVVRIQPAQVAAARWLCDWLARYADANARRAAGQDPAAAWHDVQRVWSVLFHGGRRGGKSHMACAALAAFAVMVPGTVCWAVSPTEEKTEELRTALAKLLPGAWYTYVKDARTFTLANWSSIVLRSGYKAENLKAGGIGMALYNEGQQMSESGYVQLRGATSDSGALTIVTANPPDQPIGRWVERFVEEVRARRRAALTFFFDRRLNPFIENESLDALAAETDAKTYAREILGEFVPIGDVVFHAWLDSASIRPVPTADDRFIDITRAFTRQHLGRPFDHVVGCDFDKTPHLAGAVIKVFERRADPAGDDLDLDDIPVGVPLYWVVAEAIVELSDEDGLIDALEDMGLDPATTAVICDASGLTSQDTPRSGRTSGEWFRARGWRYLFFPDPERHKNPDVIERCKLGNALLRSHAGHRRLFSAPENVHVNRAMKLWEIKHMAPYRKSKWAHACDAVTYPCWRFEGHRRTRAKAEYTQVKRFRRRRVFEGY